VLAALALLLAAWGFGRALSNSRVGRALVLETRLASLQASGLDDFVDMIGLTATELRPAGKVTIRGKRYVAVAEHGWIAAGARVRVVAADGIKLVVKVQK